MNAAATADLERRVMRETPQARHVDVAALPGERLEDMHDAAAEVLACERALAKSGTSVVGEVLRDQSDFVTWQSYPSGDVYDAETHSQYFYHAHAPADMVDGEHGHFHTFLRPAAFGLKPAPVAGFDAAADAAALVSHLIAISVDARGMPFRLFTTNRWVTGETWYSAGDVLTMLDRFNVDLALPNWAVSRWVTGMVRLFRPQVEALVTARDVAIAAWVADHPGEDVYEDRRLQVTSEVGIDVTDQIRRIEAALGI